MIEIITRPRAHLELYPIYPIVLGDEESDFFLAPDLDARYEADPADEVDQDCIVYTTRINETCIRVECYHDLVALLTTVPGQAPSWDVIGLWSLAGRPWARQLLDDLHAQLLLHQL